MKLDSNCIQPRREILRIIMFSSISARSFGAPSPETLLASVGKRYRDMQGVSIEATTRIQNSGGSSSSWVSRLRVRPPAILYEINTGGPLSSRFAFWTDGRRLRTFESVHRRFFDGEVAVRSTLTDALLASLAKARFLYWERFAHLEDSETVSRQVKEARIKVGADTLECFRLEVKPAKDQFEISTGAKETLWIEVRSGIVVRSDIQQIQGGMPISRSTLWNVVDPKLPSEEMVTLTKPLDSLDTDQPALPGK